MTGRHAPFLSSEVTVYESPDGEVRVEVRFDRETIWLSATRERHGLDDVPVD